MAKVKIFIAGKLGEAGDVSLQCDDGDAQSYAYRIANDDTRRGDFVADVPPDTQRITYTRKGSVDGTDTSGSVAYDVFDLGAFTKVLWQEEMSFCRRVLTLNHEWGRTVFGAEPDEYGFRPKARGLFSPRRLVRDDRWLKPLYETAENCGVDIPPALLGFAKLNIEPDMGGGVWTGPGQALLTDGNPDNAILPGVAHARQNGHEAAHLTKPVFELFMRLYDRSVTVAADGNHFSGICWDPIGLTEAESEVLGAAPVQDFFPGSTFFRIRDENWRHYSVIRDADGVPSSAETVVRDAFMSFFLRDMGQALIDQERVSEQTIFIDRNKMPTAMTVADPNGYLALTCDLYQD